ncbi:hypothetical protein KDU71_15715 [Carboxylicivirga sediminis]|uniref:Uncharacterized protein n=1 Tax=Carboxylicivirga sediminis TaxID=2006564 RepID=A0A941F7C8_9BACT|nr:hypothetical protein [Carboxylicivirga sediminis]MBR8537019.1 hypothetical protein [Carboxylicivirga sediminis]
MDIHGYDHILQDDFEIVVYVIFCIVDASIPGYLLTINLNDFSPFSKGEISLEVLFE